METFERAVPLPHDPDDVFAWHRRPGALERMVPPTERVDVVEDGGVVEGARTVLRVPVGPFRRRWVARIVSVDEAGRTFVDEQESGPFARWRHVHRVVAREDGGSLLTDRVEYEPPLGVLGRLALPAVRRRLERQFGWRHRTLPNELERAREHRTEAPLRVAITGASGLVGGALRAMLTTHGHEVLRLVRREPRAPDEVRWDPRGEAPVDRRLEGVDAVVHLAGETVGQLWTARRRERIRASRVGGTAALARALASLDAPPRTFVSASAVGLYGDRGDEVLDESAAHGDGFLADVCVGWEAAASALPSATRVVHLRLGVVLDPAGGALHAMLPAFRLGVAGRLGSGRQWMAWTTLDDVLGAASLALADGSASGAYNVVAPDPVRNADFTRTLGRVLRRPTVLPVPAFALRLALRRQADEMLLTSARAVPRRLLDAGHRFAWPELEPALRHVLSRVRPGEATTPAGIGRDPNPG